VILAFTVFTQCQGMTDGWTPRRRLEHGKHSAIARKKQFNTMFLKPKLNVTNIQAIN